MSFDGSGSAMTELEISFPEPLPSRSFGARRVARGKDRVDPATIAFEVESQSANDNGGSGLLDLFAPQAAYVVDGDAAAFAAWVRRRHAAVLLETVATELAQKTHASSVRAVLDVEEGEDERFERALLLAKVPPHQEDALDRLFEFVDSDWWLQLVRRFGDAVVVDIERG